jgi:diguanylate cyclase (GGDEF)-like protein
MVVASEIRKLGTSESFPHLFDLLAQFVSQVTSYRWLALVPDRARFLGLHANPATRADAERVARATFDVGSDVALAVVEDDDADPGPADAEVVTAVVLLGERPVGRIAMCPRGSAFEAESLLRIVSRELGGPLQMALLVEESQRHATIDALTGRLNRRAFVEAVGREVYRCRRYGDGLSMLLLDVDHFKAVNDQRGHAGGDLVLRALGALLGYHPRKSDLAARWGGEEFVVAMPSTSLENALLAADRLREAIAALPIRDSQGELVPVTVSIGVAALGPDDTLEQLIDRADRAMYRSKTAGRNQSHAARVGTDGQVVFDRPSAVQAA